MTMDWAAIGLDTDGTRYGALADAIATAIGEGRLRAGDQLPTHRSLARRLGLSIGTVTRAYAEAERRGLVSGEVGRGTFVRGASARPEAEWGGAAREEGVLDLSLALPWTLPGDEEGRLLAATLTAIAAESGLDELLQYHPQTALARHRAQAARWLEEAGVPATAEQVVVTAGAQHALTVLLTTLVRPGAELLTEALTYPGLIALSRALDRPLRGVELDDEGVVPGALARASGDGGARVLYVVPTAQNPTGATMSVGRRREIVDVARAHDLLIIEDDVHGPLAPDPAPPFAALAPERTVHIATVSKAVCFGLRTAFVVVPAGRVDAVVAGVRSTLWIPAPLMTEVTLRWLTDGTARGLMGRKRAESEARQALVAEVLGAHGRLEHAPFAGHAWLHLPAPWRADEFAEQARMRGVLVTPGSMFATGRANAPHAIRLCVGTPPDRATLRRGLDVLSDLLQHGAPNLAPIV